MLRATNKKYILYGAGADTEMILDLFADNILFIVDKDIKKHNSYKNGIKIYGLDMLETHTESIIVSLLGRYDMISEDLKKKYNINKNRLISLDIDGAEDYE